MKLLACLGILSLVAIAGCSKKEAPEEPSSSSSDEIEFSDPGVEFSYSSAKDDLVKIKAAIQKGEDSMFSCAAAEAYAEALVKEKDPRVKAVGEEVVKVCGYDAPLAWAETNVKKIEEAKKANPEEILIGECASIQVSLDKLHAKHKADDKVKAVEEGYKKVCPQ